MYEVEVIVAAPDQYADIARVLAHEISKIKGNRAAYWSIKQYEGNELQLGAQRLVILLGDAEENKFTKVYASLTSLKKSDGGACYGFDGSKAVILGEGWGERSIKETVAALKQDVSFLQKYGHLAIPISLTFLLGIFLGPVAGWLAYRNFKKKQLKEVKMLQTKIGAEYFLKEQLSAWLESA